MNPLLSEGGHVEMTLDKRRDETYWAWVAAYFRGDVDLDRFGRFLNLFWNYPRALPGPPEDAAQ